MHFMQATGRGCMGGLAQFVQSEVLARAGAARASLGPGSGGQPLAPLVSIGPMPPRNPATVYPFSKSAVLRRLLSDQVRVRGPRVLLVSDSFVRLLRPKLIRPYRSHPNT